jgi:hypothetical protein
MSKLNTVAKDGLLTLPDGSTIPLDSPEWHQWLADNHSFRFETSHGAYSYTARKDTIKSGSYWYAYRKIKGQLYKRYLGNSRELDQERLDKVADLLVKPSQSERSPVLGNSFGNSDDAELEQERNRSRLLQRQLENAKAECEKLKRQLEQKERDRLNQTTALGTVYFQLLNQLHRAKAEESRSM